MKNRKIPKKVYLISLSTATEARLKIKAVTVRITHNVLLRSINDLVAVELFPQRDLPREEFLSKIGTLANNCRGRNCIIAVSVMTNDYHLLAEVSEIVREKAPDTPIIAGGPHFVDNTDFSGGDREEGSTAAKSLKDGVVDFVNIGEGSGLRDLILGIREGSLEMVRDSGGFTLRCLSGEVPRGIRYRGTDRRMEGMGKGSMPRINHGNPYIIPIRYRSGVGANFNLSNRCPNNCNYCNSPKHLFGLEVESYFDELEEITSGEKVTILQANDNHPLERCNREKTFRFLDAFERRYKTKPVLYNFFIDPSTLIEEGEDAWDFLKGLEGGVHQLQFGRECTDEKVASALGRHYHGAPRGQSRLDAEGDAIKRLAAILPRTRFKVFYILTPFESEESVLKTVSEVESFTEYGNIYTGSNLLWPLPGSTNRKRYHGKYFPYEDVPPEVIGELKLVTPVEINFWHRSFPASDFLDYLMGTGVKMYAEPLLPNNTAYHLSMMRIIASISFGTYQPGRTVPEIIKELDDIREQKPGDINLDFTDRILDLGGYIDGEELYDCSERSKIRFAGLVRGRFWLWNGSTLEKFKRELQSIYSFRKSYFSKISRVTVI